MILFTLLAWFAASIVAALFWKPTLDDLARRAGAKGS
jgi:hypothetical protein